MEIDIANVDDTHTRLPAGETIRLVRGNADDRSGWLALRQRCLANCPREEHLAEIALFLGQPDRYAGFIAYSKQGAPLGLAEVSLRNDHVDNASSAPVAFLEGLFVAPEARRQGIARRLADTIANWAVESGCHALASDLPADDLPGRAIHKIFGFEASGRDNVFRRPLFD